MPTDCSLPTLNMQQQLQMLMGPAALLELLSIDCGEMLDFGLGRNLADVIHSQAAAWVLLGSGFRRDRNPEGMADFSPKCE